MRKVMIAVAVASALVFAACGESTAVLDENRVLVSDADGKVDARQIKEACEARGKQVDSWTETSLDIHDGQVLVVTCK